ncbi:flavin reductase family protein [Actinophytocola sp.]|uniref:flavin reductase family protein n=1 Tax=Actinophytocola sp. TaxID=1872138 RepID=UPI00389A9B41
MIDAPTFRAAMATLAAPLTVLTYYDAHGRPGGLTVSSVCSLSVDPPRVLFCVNQANQSHDAAVGAGRWCLHVLGVGHEDLAHRFAGPGDRFRDLPVLAAAAPELPDVPTRLALTADGRRDGGDHTIVVARVTHATGLRDGGGLVWHQRAAAAAVHLDAPARRAA